MATTKQTDRESLIEHFVESGLGFDHPTHDVVDLVVYLAQHIQHGTIFNHVREYVEKIVKAGTQSSVGKELLIDIRKAVAAVNKASEESTK